MDPSTTEEGGIFYNLCRRFTIALNIGNTYIYIMYVYGCNYIMITEMKNRSDKEIIQPFTEFTTDLNSHGIKPGLHFMDSEASIEFLMARTTMEIKYHLVLPSNHCANNSDRFIQMIKKHS